MHIRIVLTLTLAGTAALAPAQTPQFVISTLAGAPLAATPVPALSVAIGSPRGIATDTAGIVYSTSATQGGNGIALLKLDPNGILTRMTGAQFRGPSAAVSGVVVDKSGNAYITNSGVLKVSSDGTVTTIAGNGGSGSSGDGGPAISAALNPSGLLAVDAIGNLYVGEPSRIRKISLDGIITTIAGDGSYGFAGDGGLAASAQFGEIDGLTVDPAGNLYVSDRYYIEVDCLGDTMLTYSRLRRISPDGTIQTIAGGIPGTSGDGGPAISAQFQGLGPLATDNAGDLYLVDDSRVRKISTDGTILTIAGSGNSGYSGDGGPALNALLGYPSGLAADSAGNLYIADGTHIRRISATGTISTVAGEANLAGGASLGDGGPAYTALVSPTGVAVDSAGTVFIADTFNNRVRKVTGDGIITTIAGSGFFGGVAGDGLQALKVDLYWPAGLALDSSGSLYIAEAGGGRIRKISPDGVITTVAGTIQAIVAGSSGDGGLATNAQLWWPKDVALDSSGNLYIADTGNNRVRMVTPAGIITTVAGSGASGFSYPGFGYSGDGGPALSARLNLPSGVAVDSFGNLYVADTNNYRVRKISSSGIITTIAGNGIPGWSGDGGPAVQAQLTYPVGLKLDNAGNLYIADGTTVRMVSPAGIIATVAGTGVLGLSGDGGPATGAQIGAWGLAFDGAGDLYVADPFGDIVRVLRPTGQ